MLMLRSLLFNVALWVGSIGITIFFLPTVLLPKTIVFVPKMWGRMTLFFLRYIVGIRCQVEGMENLPQGGGFLIASKHQSAWETCAFNAIFPRTSFILKKELMYFVPLNFYMYHTGMIPLDRKGGKKTLKEMIARARGIMEMDRPLVIFPEGTRSAVGDSLPYKHGIFTLYKNLEKPVVPVAINAGVYWKRRDFIKRPGTIRVKIMPAIQPGLGREEFMETLEHTIESESQKLLEGIKT